MRRSVRAVFIAREYLEWRLEEMAEGAPLDLREELQRLGGVVGMLVDVGVLDPSDWRVEGKSWSENPSAKSDLSSNILWRGGGA